MTNAIVKKKKVCYNNTGGSLKNKNRNYCMTKRILVHQILKIWRK